MKVVILAGGLGTRISEYTKTIPKPMIKIKNKPILRIIIDHYMNYGFNDFTRCNIWIDKFFFHKNIVSDKKKGSKNCPFSIFV